MLGLAQGPSPNSILSVKTGYFGSQAEFLLRLGIHTYTALPCVWFMLDDRITIFIHSGPISYFDIRGA